ncbi:hypothetical protein R3P38DRAFT_2806732 [Favolaschia claudopus]|uniref:Uncharacterized protein n=1 Tax=Favolaschia claudopus TaxID=2862362 RepID=A0AAV9ZJ52_9AGAR
MASLMMKKMHPISTATRRLDGTTVPRTFTSAAGTAYGPRYQPASVPNMVPWAGADYDLGVYSDSLYPWSFIDATLPIPPDESIVPTPTNSPDLAPSTLPRLPTPNITSREGADYSDVELPSTAVWVGSSLHLLDPGIDVTKLEVSDVPMTPLDEEDRSPTPTPTPVSTPAVSTPLPLFTRTPASIAMALGDSYTSTSAPPSTCMMMTPATAGPFSYSDPATIAPTIKKAVRQSKTRAPSILSTPAIIDDSDVLPHQPDNQPKPDLDPFIPTGIACYVTPLRPKPQTEVDLFTPSVIKSSRPLKRKDMVLVEKYLIDEVISVVAAPTCQYNLFCGHNIVFRGSLSGTWVVFDVAWTYKGVSYVRLRNPLNGEYAGVVFDNLRCLALVHANGLYSWLFTYHLDLLKQGKHSGLNVLINPKNGCNWEPVTATDF